MAPLDSAERQVAAQGAAAGAAPSRMRPVLLAFKGHPGSGKSALSDALGRALGWPVVDKDDIKDVLDGRSPDAGGLAYEVMFRVVQRQLWLGLSVICDSPLAFEQAYHLARNMAISAGAALLVVETRCDDPIVWRQRIEQRSALGLPAHHQTTWEGLESYVAEAEPRVRYPIPTPHLIVDTTRPLPAVLDDTIDWIAEQRHK
jgi:predicted kinase